MLHREACCCCNEKTSYVSNCVFFILLHEWVDRGQKHQLEKLYAFNSEFITRSVLLEFFLSMHLPSIAPFMQ